GRAQKCVEIGAAASEPRKAEQAQQRLAVRRLVEPRIRLERIRNAERSKCRLEGRLPPLERRADDSDLLRSNAGSKQRQELFADELERAALAGAFKEADRCVDRRRLRHGLGKESPLEMRERRGRNLIERRWQLLDASVRKAGEIIHG